ncbi:uncharacterized protein LOC62_03G003543 [Vanrija pseudolonga]|uniref:Uncharacterized protein n=1 Tax=Vanrija pseudolonga TaxID=143232 RepID=A0AAF0Y8E9_9TREE|nr:hypothetical protein LOC62_03G003543 [Vanrija pseudolonga]
MTRFGECRYYPTISRWIQSMCAEEPHPQFMCRTCIQDEKPYCWEFIDVTDITDDGFMNFLRRFGEGEEVAADLVSALRAVREWQVGEIAFEEFQQISNYEAYLRGAF